MGKQLYIAEKPSVAKEFAKALKLDSKNKDGYMEAENAIVTWCVGHLVTMSYPEVYDEKYKKWQLNTLPFIPEQFKYEVIPNVQKQYNTVSSLLNRPDVDTIYVCTDSGREGEYIYRLVEMQAGVTGKLRKRVWIDSQTEEEILRGIREAKNLEEYDSLSESAFLRAKEDYLMGINFSRVLTLKSGYHLKEFLKNDKSVISVGRVMTCVLGMVVNREREIRVFDKTPFFRVVSTSSIGESTIEGEWRAVEGSRFYQSPLLYKENGFQKIEDANQLVSYLEEVRDENGITARITSIEKKKETKNPPLLYNLAELQNECAKLFKISPDETLRIVQELYEKKLTTYPRTDARVLSTAVCKEIDRNLKGLCSYSETADFAKQILTSKSYQNLAKTRYVNDKQITDHYAIIPTGQGLQTLSSLTPTAEKVYEIISRRFLSIFYPPAIYQKIAIVTMIREESFFHTFKVLKEEGYLALLQYSFSKKKVEKESEKEVEKEETTEEDTEEESKCDSTFLEKIEQLKKGQLLPVMELLIKEGETSPPKRYNSGSIILTMENAGQFIEEEELRAQIKGSGIGTSATRAEILKKLVMNQYLSLNKKTQIIMPTLMGELIYEVVSCSIKPLLDPALTASWEKGLTMVAEGTISSEDYMKKLDDFVTRRTKLVKEQDSKRFLNQQFLEIQQFYKK